MPSLTKRKIVLKQFSLNLCRHHLPIVFVILLSGCVDELFIIEKSLLSNNDLKPIAGHYHVQTLNKDYATLKIGTEIAKHEYAANKSCDALSFKYGYGENKPQFVGIACFSRLPGSDLVIMATPGEKTKSYDQEDKESVLDKNNNPFVLMRFSGDQLEIWTWDKSLPVVAKNLESSRWSTDPLKRVHSFLSNNWQKYIADQTKITFSRSTEREEKIIESMLAAEAKPQQMMLDAKKILESKLILEKKAAELKSLKTTAKSERHDGIKNDDKFLSEHIKLLAGKLNLVEGKPESREVSIYAALPQDDVKYAFTLFLYEAESDCTFPVSSPYPTERTKVFWRATLDYQSSEQIFRQGNMFSLSDKSTQWKAWPETGQCKPELSLVKPEPATKTILDLAIRTQNQVDLEISKESLFSSSRKRVGSGSFSLFDMHDSLFLRSVPSDGMDDPDGYYFVTSSIIGKIKVVGMKSGDYKIEITQVHATDWSRLHDGETFATGFWKPGYQRLVVSEYDRTEHCGIVRSELISNDFIPFKFDESAGTGWQLKKNTSEEAICKVRRLVDCKVDGCLKWSSHEDFSNTSSYIVKNYQEAQSLFNGSKKITKSMMPSVK